MGKYRWMHTLRQANAIVRSYDLCNGQEQRWHYCNAQNWVSPLIVLTVNSRAVTAAGNTYHKHRRSQGVQVHTPQGDIKIFLSTFLGGEISGLNLGVGSLYARLVYLTYLSNTCKRMTSNKKVIRILCKEGNRVGAPLQQKSWLCLWP